MGVFNSGVLKVLPHYPQEVLRLDIGDIQHGYSTINVLTPNHYIRSSNLATLYPHDEVENNCQ